MYLDTAVDGFLLSLSADGYSPATIALYTWALGILRVHINENELSKITEQKLKALFAYLYNGYTPSRKTGSTEPLSPRSIENIWTCYRSFFGWAERELGNKRPDLSIKRPRYKPAEIKPLTHEQIKALLSACTYSKTAETQRRKSFAMRRPTAERDTGIILVLLDTGLRASELCRLTVGDLDQSTGEIIVKPYGTGRKTKARIVYLGKAARRSLWRYLARRGDILPSDPLFITVDDRPLNRNALRVLLRDIGKRAGVAGCHPHIFRHTFAIEYLRNKGDVFTLERILGHASLSMVQRYLAIVDADGRERHKTASPVDNWKL